MFIFKTKIISFKNRYFSRIAYYFSFLLDSWRKNYILNCELILKVSFNFKVVLILSSSIVTMNYIVMNYTVMTYTVMNYIVMSV